MSKQSKSSDKGASKSPTTREGRREASKRLKARKRQAARRERLRQEAAAKARASNGPRWRRPFDPSPDGAPQIPQATEHPGTAPETEPPTPEATLPAVPAAPELPEPEVDKDLARDRVRQEKAVAKALADDDDLLKRLLKAEDEVLAERDRGPIRSGDGDVREVTSDCRICGAEGEGTFKSNYVCSSCIGSMSFPYHNGGFDDREANIRAMIAKLARLRATKLTVPCAECGDPVPDPDGLNRDDQLCDGCYRVLFGESRLDRRSMRTGGL